MALLCGCCAQEFFFLLCFCPIDVIFFFSSTCPVSFTTRSRFCSQTGRKHIFRPIISHYNCTDTPEPWKRYDKWAKICFIHTRRNYNSILFLLYFTKLQKKSHPVTLQMDDGNMFSLACYTGWKI